jgi:hypothetical protein
MARSGCSPLIWGRYSEQNEKKAEAGLSGALGSLGTLEPLFGLPFRRDTSFHFSVITSLICLAMSSNFPFFLADMVFYLSEHLENSEKLTEASGCFLYFSQQVYTKNAYDDILLLGFLGSPLPIFSFLLQQGTESPNVCPAVTCPSTVSKELSCTTMAVDAVFF